MAMSVGSPDGDEEQMNSSINTTPLVDVMLVLLIIFLITIPVVTQSIQLAVSKDGDIYWNTRHVASVDELVERLKKESVKEPQPEVHIRGDQDVRYESVGRVVVACQRAGIAKVGFITEPPPNQ